MTKPDFFDVAIIGAGVVGAAIARELTRYELGVALVEAAPDVGMGTSKASTAIWHTGFDAMPGSLEARLMRRGHSLMEAFTDAAGIPVERSGGLLVTWNAEQQAALPALLDKARQNGVTDACLVEAGAVYRLEPCLGPGATGGMLVPGEGILCTYTLPLACATQAVINGATLKLNHAVGGITADPDGNHVLESPAGLVRCRYLVNAAGLYSDEINRMMGQAEFNVTPRRGELIIFNAFLQHEQWPEPGVPVVAEPPLAWVCPNVIAPGLVVQRFRYRSREFKNHVRLEVRQGGSLLHTQALPRMIVNESMVLPGDWVNAVQAGGEPVRLAVVQ